MEKIKNFFNIDEHYQFEWNDLRAVMTVINVILIMTYGLSVAWVGLAISVIGVVRDLTKERRVSGLVMHLATVALNLYFIFFV